VPNAYLKNFVLFVPFGVTLDYIAKFFQIVMEYTDFERTKQYLKQLSKWAVKVDNCKEKDETSRDLYIYKNFPINKKGDIALILEPTSLDYFSCGERKTLQEGWDDGLIKKLKNSPAKVGGLFDCTTADYHGGPDGDYDLIINSNLSSDSFLCDTVSPAYRCDLPTYLFLPHPKKLEEFKKILPYMTTKPKELEKILESYYKKCQKTSSKPWNQL